MTYRTWSSALPDWIDVCALELPGRGTRWGEVLLPTMAEILRHAIEAADAIANRPLAIFGYSMGARIGFELARARAQAPVHLFAAAAPAPHLPKRRRLGHLAEPALIAALRKMNGIPGPVLDDREFLELLLPVVQNDLRAVEDHVGSCEPPLDVPITVFTGSRDEDVTPAEAEAWARCTTRPALARPFVFDAGHFFLEANLPRIHAELVARLAATT